MSKRKADDDSANGISLTSPVATSSSEDLCTSLIITAYRAACSSSNINDTSSDCTAWQSQMYRLISTAVRCELSGSPDSYPYLSHVQKHLNHQYMQNYKNTCDHESGLLQNLMRLVMAVQDFDGVWECWCSGGVVDKVEVRRHEFHGFVGHVVVGIVSRSLALESALLDRLLSYFA